ncbi:MAG: carboxymuconolactone decarboxylase family protein [Acidobacteriota bacterium]|nr:carboxymuconolactone decarboxylase family protein [Acidobacteriota bacterium]
MEARLKYWKAAPEVLQAMSQLQNVVNQSGLDRGLLDLVTLRVSQINGCAFCIDMHVKDARAHGEPQERLDLLVAWRESPFYTDRERAALAWAEAVTLFGEGHVSDEVYLASRAHFSEAELVKLTLALVTINGWNRLNVAFRTIPGKYQAAAGS